MARKRDRNNDTWIQQPYGWWTLDVFGGVKWETLAELDEWSGPLTDEPDPEPTPDPDPEPEV